MRTQTTQKKTREKQVDMPIFGPLQNNASLSQPNIFDSVTPKEIIAAHEDPNVPWEYKAAQENNFIYVIDENESLRIVPERHSSGNGKHNSHIDFSDKALCAGRATFHPAQAVLEMDLKTGCEVPTGKIKAAYFTVDNVASDFNPSGPHLEKLAKKVFEKNGAGKIEFQQLPGSEKFNPKTATHAKEKRKVELPGFSRELKTTEERKSLRGLRDRTREINLQHIHLDLKKLPKETLAKKQDAQKKQEAYAESVRKNESKEKQEKLALEFTQSVASFGDAISKNLANGGFRTASRVIGSVSNGLSAGISSFKIGKCVTEWTGSAKLGNTTTAVGIGIAAFTTLMGICGDDSSSSGLSELESRLCSHMDHRFDRMESLIRSSTQAIREDIRVLGQLVTQAINEIRQVSDICQETLRALSELTIFVHEQAAITSAQLQSIHDHSLDSARFVLEQYNKAKEELIRTKKTDIIDPPSQENFDQVTMWLLKRAYQSPINESDYAKFSPDRVASLLKTHQLKNIVMPGFLASRLHFHFSDYGFDRFTTLPPMPLFLDLAKTYLKSLEYAEKVSPQNQAVCDKIKETIQLYLDFIDTLKTNPEIVQALFDQYAYYQRKNDKQSLSLMNELRELLNVVVPLTGNKKFEEKLAALDNPAKPVTPTDIWDQLPKTLDESERIKKLCFSLLQDNAPNAQKTKYMLLPEAMPYTAIPSQIEWAPYGAPNAESKSQWGSGYFPNHPKPPAFITTSMLLLLLASGYADVNFFRNSTLRKHVELLTKSCPGMYSRTVGGGSYSEVRFDDTGWVRASSAELTSQGYTYHVRYNGREYSVTTDRVRSGYDQGRTEYPFNYNSSLYGGHRANIFQFQTQLQNTLPPEYKATLDAVDNGFLKKIPNAFKYAMLVFQGELSKAKLFADNNPFDHASLLFLVSLINRPDIFETYIKKFPLPTTFRFYQKIDGTELTPSGLAIQLGNQDVANYIHQKFDEVSSRTPKLPLPETELEKELQEQIDSVEEYEDTFEDIAEVLAEKNKKLIDVSDNEEDDEGLYQAFDDATAEFCATRPTVNAASFWERRSDGTAFDKPGRRVSKQPIPDQNDRKELLKALRKHGITSAKKIDLEDAANHFYVDLPTKSVMV